MKRGTAGRREGGGKDSGSCKGWPLQCVLDYDKLKGPLKHIVVVVAVVVAVPLLMFFIQMAVN